MHGMVATWPKNLPPFWIFSLSVRAILQLSNKRNLPLKTARPQLQMSLCLHKRHRFGKESLKDYKTEKPKCKIYRCWKKPSNNLLEHTDSLEWDYVLSVSISPLNWLQHLIRASKFLRRGQMNTTNFFHHLKVIRIRALHAPEASN